MPRLTYFLSETATNLKRNFLMTIAAVSTVAISLLLLGGVQILGLVVNNMTANWEAKVEVSVFLLDGASDEEIQALGKEVSGFKEVEDVHFVTKTEAFEEFKQRYADKPEFWETLPPNSLPQSYRVELFDADDAEGVSARLRGAPGVEEVKYGGEFVKTLLRVNTLLRTVTFVMSIVLMVAAAGLIANAIRLAIYARRDEVAIMKLVGATNWFIRVPFMLEGIIAALVGAIVAGVIVIATNALLLSQVSDLIPLFESMFRFSNGELLQVLFVMTGVGALVGLIGSSLALRRFLEA